MSSRTDKIANLRNKMQEIETYRDTCRVKMTQSDLNDPTQKKEFERLEGERNTMGRKHEYIVMLIAQMEFIEHWKSVLETSTSAAETARTRSVRFGEDKDFWVFFEHL